MVEPVEMACAAGVDVIEGMPDNVPDIDPLWEDAELGSGCPGCGG